MAQTQNNTSPPTTSTTHTKLTNPPRPCSRRTSVCEPRGVQREHGAALAAHGNLAAGAADTVGVWGGRKFIRSSAGAMFREMSFRGSAAFYYRKNYNLNSDLGPSLRLISGRLFCRRHLRGARGPTCTPCFRFSVCWEFGLYWQPKIETHILRKLQRL